MHISEPLNEFSQTEHPPHNQHPDQETECYQPSRRPSYYVQSLTLSLRGSHHPDL